MAPSSLSSLYLSHHHQANPFPSLTPKPTFPRLPPRPQNLAFSSKQSAQTQNQDQNQNQDQTLKLNSPQPDKKSFAIDTGELFLGFASQLIKGLNNRKAASAGSETSFFRDGLNRASVNGGRRGARYESKERIGIVIEDEIEPDVIWEQRIKDVEAEQKRRVVTSPGFSFSAAGLLFPYHLGVAQFLIDKGYIKVVVAYVLVGSAQFHKMDPLHGYVPVTNQDNEERILADRLQDDPLNSFDVPVTDRDNEETTPLAGSSAGAVVCAVIASGASMEEGLMATKVFADDCRRRGTAFRLGAVLRDVLDKFLPEDAHTRSNGRVRIAITQILRWPRGLLVDQFDSKEDLINAVLASSFIPGYTAPQPATLFRNRLCIDGALTMLMPPTSAAQTVRVCAFSAIQLRLQGIGISPDCNPENRGCSRDVFNWALTPAEDDILDRLFELGYLDAAVWAEENPVAEEVEDDFPFVKNGSA